MNTDTNQNAVWLTPEQRREKYATETPKKKRGRPYKNPNLVPQGLADYIRKLEKENADLKAQIAQSQADNEDANLA